jgi:WD40 repeat protein
LLDFRFPRHFEGAPHRRLAIYLDTIYERATHDFFQHTIQPALRDSAHLIVVRTPAALRRRDDGEPNWVEREIDYFRELPQRDQISAAVAIGEITDPRPAKLHDRLRNIEVVDIRRIRRPWRASSDELLKFIAALYEIPAARMPELRAEQQKRRSARLRWLASGALVLAAVMTGLAAFALLSQQRAQRSEARAVEARRIAVARQLAAESSVTRLEVGSEIEQSVLLAIQSYRREPTPEGEQALRASTSLILPRLAAFENDGAETNICALRPDAAAYATAAFGGYVTMYDVRTGRATGTLPAELEAQAVTFSADSASIAVRSPGGLVTVWNATGDERDVEGRLQRNAVERKSGISELTIAPAERLKMVRNAAAFRYACTVSDDDAPLTISNRGVVAAAGDRSVVVVDCMRRRSLHVLHQMRARALAFDADGARLVTAGWDGSVNLWSTTSGARLKHFDHDGIVNTAAISSDGRYLVTSSEDKTARLWEIESGRERLRIQHPRAVRAATLSTDGSLLATNCDDRAARVWETARGREVARLHESGSGLAVGFDRATRTLVTCDFGFQAAVWDLASLSSEAKRVQLGERVSQLASLPDDRVLAVLQDGRLVVIDPALSRVLGTLGNPQVAVSAISSDGSLITVSVRNSRFSRTYSTVRVSNGSSRRWQEQPLATAADRVAWRSGKWVVVSRVDDGRELSRWQFEQLRGAPVFTPDGAFLAVADSDSLGIYSVARENAFGPSTPSEQARSL